MFAIFAALGPWVWIITGLILMLIELAAPGLFFIWLGLAALATGVIVGIGGLGWTTASLVFAALAAAAVVVGRRLTRRPPGAPVTSGTLNAPDRGLIGRTVRLEQAIQHGEGRVRINDTVWIVSGPDIAAGAMVRIARLDGATLVVEPA